MTGRTITKTVEYDDEGRVTKETTVEVEWPEPIRDSGQWWQTPGPGWWQNPVISYTGDTSHITRQTVAAVGAQLRNIGQAR